MTNQIQGNRIDSPFTAHGERIGEWPQPGDYWFYPEQGWCAMTPSGHMANLSALNVVEHEDRTITVSPSILVSLPANDETPYREPWHGFLEHGVWRKCR